MECSLLAWPRVLQLGTAALLPTNSFLNAYRLFMCHRAPIRQMKTDRSTISWA